MNEPHPAHEPTLIFDHKPQDRSGFRGMRWDEPPLSDALRDADLSMTPYRWPMNPRTCPPAGWVDLIHDATWEGEE